jgi:Fur family peroxide stress response transcriptional regulator
MKTVESLTNTLKANGMKITPQRLMIFRCLEGNTSHPSAEEIYKKVKEVYPTVSFTTIYKTLETLRDLGEIAELTLDEERKHYDPNTETHHHIICSVCKKILDIFDDFSSLIKVPNAVKKDYTVDGFQISFYGTCKECG